VVGNPDAYSSGSPAVLFCDACLHELCDRLCSDALSDGVNNVYRNNPATRTIDVDLERAPMIKRIFELYAAGEHSLITLRKTVLNELGLRLARSYFETILKNRFYLGYFVWQGIEYKGTHQPMISAQLFDQVQDVFAGRNKPKHRKHAFAFSGLLKCAHDGCTVTAERQKGNYV
jgi:site-specific DNA recombinase